jgi:cytochrome c2
VLFWTGWYAASLVMVLLIPAYARFGRPIWELPPNLLPQALAIGAAYLALSLFLRLGAGSTGWAAGAVAVAVCFGAAGALLYYGNNIAYSRILLVVAGALCVPLAFIPFVFGRLSTVVGSTLAVGFAVLAAGRLFSRATDEASMREEVILTALQAVTFTHHRDLVDPPGSNGGAIAAYAKGFLLVTGSGEFYRLDWTPSGDSLRSKRLPLTAPLDLETFHADFQFEPGARRLRIRVTGLLLDTSSAPVRLFLAHQHWNHDDRCSTMRVSTVDLQPGGDPDRFSSDWKSIFESQPCLSPAGPGYDDAETGGRLAWGPKKQLVLTLGELGQSGKVEGKKELSLAQRRDADWGKILVLDGAGGRTVFSLGHRNPQGLFVDRNGRIWSTEHGPEGGDELNLVEKGRNYGWPLATYGTDYGLDFWPFSAALDHGEFREPALAFLPSVGISNLIGINSEQFPNWAGDLLIGSLRKKSLYRVRLRDDRVIYTEPIFLNREIRDLVEAPDGRIVMWNDEEREVTSLSRATAPPSGEAVYNAQCLGCHEPVPGTTTSVGPPLTGVLGKPVASGAGFAYSAGLRSLGGSWTRERLDAFLSDPATYAPGNGMDAGRIADSTRRRAVIEYLSRRK